MAGSYVGQNSGSGSGTTVSVTRSVTSGNLLLLAMGHGSGTQTITNDGGQTWTQRAALTGGNPQITIWSATANTTGSITVDITKGSSNAYAVCMAEFNDHDTASPVAATDTETLTSGTSKYMSSPAMTPPTDGIFFGAAQHSGTPTGASFTSATQVATSGRGLWCYRLGANAEDGAYTHTSALTSVAAAVTINPATAATGQPMAKRWGGIPFNAVSRGGVW